QLPRTLPELEKFIGVDSTADLTTQLTDGDSRKVIRGAVVESGVSRNNRGVERYRTSSGGWYWKSYDFKTTASELDLLPDPVHLHPDGGEMIFSRANGLQGYYIANGAGKRLDFAPTEIVTDSFASDKTVRNGLSCIRCHDSGMKTFKDKVRATVLNLTDTPS